MHKKQIKPKTKSPEKVKPEKTKKLPQPDLTIKEPEDTRVMNLEKSRTLISKILLGIILFLLTFFFARTAIWEHNYYHEKEGLPRAVANLVEEVVQEVSEEEPTEQEIREHTVAPDEPRYLSIAKLGIRNARILKMGINQNGELDTPYSIFDVGWYGQSSKPGTNGVLVMDGHNGGPNVEGVFKHINQLYAGDEIVIERGDGQLFTYKVVDNQEVSLADADAYMTKAFQSPVPGRESLTLISCIGEWSQVQQTYLSRQFTRAVLEK